MRREATILSTVFIAVGMLSLLAIAAVQGPDQPLLAPTPVTPPAPPTPTPPPTETYGMPDRQPVRPRPERPAGGQPPPPDACALLDDPEARGLMSAVLETRLLIECGREKELGGGAARPGVLLGPSAPGTDVPVNDPTGDAGGSSHTQSETTIRVNLNTGTICSAYNDSYHGIVEGTGFSGFSRSTDGGATFVDRGVHPGGGGGTSGGDPSLVWRRSDGRFYYAALHTNGLAIWRSTDDCNSFDYLAMIHTGYGDDKEMMEVDNNPLSPYYGRLYVAWTDFAAGGAIFVTHSDDGVTWSTPVQVSASGASVQGAWPAIAPNGDVYVAWVRWNPYPDGPIDVEVVRSTDGGASFSPVTNPLTGAVNPRDATATSTCGRPALNGNIRYLPSPQIAVGPDGCLHVVYSYDPDGYNNGDVVNVYYRRSCNNGTTWGPEVQLNDDSTTTDQWFPTISVGPGNVVVAAWYDRRLDTANNYTFDYYRRISYDGGTSWQSSDRVSDVSSPVYIDPRLASCYHGDYDQQTQDNIRVYMQWSDDRNVQDGHNDPDVWFEREQLITRTGVLTGTVYDSATLAPIGSAPVQASPNQTQTFGTTSNGSGLYNMVVVSGVYTVTGGPVYGYQVTSIPGVVVPEGTTVTQNIPLTPTARYLLSGTVTDSTTGDPLLAFINISGDPVTPPTTTIQTDPTTGQYSITLAAEITYTLNVTAPLHIPTTTIVAPLVTDTVEDITLDPYPPILLVDDDAGDDMESRYRSALDNNGYEYYYWDTNVSGSPNLNTLQAFDVVIWFTGADWSTTLSPSDESKLAAYLDGGGRLFFSSQDYLWDVGLTDFGRDYLHIGDYANDRGHTQVTGTNVFNGYGPYSLSYPFNNYSDDVWSDGISQAAFTGNATDNPCALTSGCAFKTAFFAYPFEALAPVDADTVMSRTIAWLQVPPPTYGTRLFPSTRMEIGGLGAVVTYTQRVYNLGTNTDRYTLTVSGNAWPTTIWDATFTTQISNTGDITPCSSTAVGVRVAIPSGANAGDYDVATLQATSATSPTISDSAVITTMAICSPSLTFAGQSEWAPSLDDTYDYGGQKFTYLYINAHTTSGRESMNATLQAYDPDLGMWHTLGQWWSAGPHQLLIDRFDIPPTYSAVRVRLNDNWGDQVYYDYRFIVCREPAVDLDPAERQRFAQPGATVVYTQTVTNYTMGVDSFTLSASGNGWPTTFWDGTTQINSVGPLADGESSTFTVRVEVPANADMGNSDLATIRAQSVGSPPISDTASLRTAIMVYPWAQAFSDHWAPDGSSDREQYLDIARLSGVVTARMTDDLRWQNGAPAVAAYPRGAIVAAWTGPYMWNGTAGYINIEYAAFDTNGNAVVPITQVSDNVSATIYTSDWNPVLAVAPTNGNVLIAWHRYEDDSAGNWRYNIHYALRGPDGSEVLSPTALTTNTGPSVRDGSPGAAAFSDGRFVIAWDHWDDASGASDIYYVVLDSIGGVIAGPLNLTNNPANHSDYQPRANRLADGNVLLTWSGYHDSSADIYYAVYYAVLDSAGGVVHPVTLLADMPYSAHGPDAVGLHNGNTLIAWEQWGHYPEGGSQIVYTVLDDTYTVTAAIQTLTNTLEIRNYDVSVARDGDDNAVLTWRNDTNYRIYYALVDNTGGVLTWPMVLHTTRSGWLEIGRWGAANGSVPSVRIYLPIVVRNYTGTR